jgi:hypothetical protein
VIDEQLKGALRALLLPIRPELEARAISAASETLAKGRVAEADQAEFLKLERERWRQSGKPNGIFADAVRSYLRAGEPQFGDVLARRYFAIHASLSARAQFDHSLAAALLSHARLIAVLGIEDRLSSAQISQLLSRRDPRLPSSWEAVQSVLGEIDSRPELDLAQVEELFAVDIRLEETAFGDAELGQCAELVGRMAEELGLSDSFETALRVIATEPFAPHLKMLHFLCVIAEYYDHPLQFAYEFHPRGQISRWVANQYPAALGKTGSDFLNNAKSVDVLDRGWANSKKRAISRQAHALVTVVESLSGLGFSARRELATWIRRLLVRIIRLSEGAGTTLPPFEQEDVAKLLEAVSHGPTNTLGIIEQRIVDALAFLRCPPPEWVSRGLGDSVNATNISRRKCGDCDFQDAKNRVVAAFEPHAGKLSDVYVNAHALTLERVLDRRIDEWAQTVGLGGGWFATVTFVAHEIPSNECLAEITLPEVTAEIRAVTFEEFLGGVDLCSRETLIAFNGLVREPLTKDRTPDAVRRALLSIIA